MVEEIKLIGPFKEIVTMRNLSLYGALSDEQLEIIRDGGVLVKENIIIDVDTYSSLSEKYPSAEKEIIDQPMVLMPGLVDAHTHICYGGSRENDYALRVAGKSYLDIAKSGGGIISTVKNTRLASEEELVEGICKRADILLQNGVTTCEIKSGYGLSVEDELKMLRAIKKADETHIIDFIPTCLAAHTKAPEFASVYDYTHYIIDVILPKVKEENLASRVDIFVEDSAFDAVNADLFLNAAQKLGFDLVVHADQFTAQGSKLAAKYKALSADHLEASTEVEIDLLAKAEVCGVLLPGCSMGLGIQYPHGRLMLDKGMCIAIASDWNPGSAPMGDLLMQASVFGAFEKLTTAETLAAITFRAAKALNLADRGVIEAGKKSHLIAFSCQSYKEILYYQGTMKPSKVWL